MPSPNLVRLFRALALFCVICGIMAVSAGQPLHAQTYTLTDLGTLGGPSSWGGGVNNLGQATGSSWTGNGTGTVHAFVYTPGATPAMVDIGQIYGPANYTTGAAINSVGQVTGQAGSAACAASGSISQAAPGCNASAFVFTPSPGGGTFNVIPLSAGWIASGGAAINESGQVAGDFFTQDGTLADGLLENAFAYLPGVSPAVVAIPTLGGVQNAVRGIDAASDIVGYSTTNTGSSAAFKFAPFAPHPSPSALPMPQNAQCAQGLAVSVTGSITGSFGASCGFLPPPLWLAGRVFSYSKGTVVDIGVPNGAVAAAGLGINSQGQVVGIDLTDFGVNHAFVLNSDPQISMTDLNSAIDPKTPLPDNVTLIQGEAISDTGWILADGRNSVSGATHAYLLQPETSAPPPCVKEGAFVVCTLKPTLCGTNGFSFCAAACAFPGCVRVLLTWAPPLLNGGDPWLDGLAVKAMAPNWSVAHQLSNVLKVVVRNEPASEDPGGRRTDAALIRNGRPFVTAAKIEALTVEIANADPAGLPSMDLIELSLPYNPKLEAQGQDIRLVRFDKALGRWVDVDDQYVTVSRHTVTAHVTANGRFTVVAAPNEGSGARGLVTTGSP